MSYTAFSLRVCDAKGLYQWALEDREHTAYHEGIARMKAKPE
ncbi:MAG: hypothetical protein ACM31E_04690 [Fibrobacterota bacterium]